MAKVILPDVPQVVKVVMKGTTQGQPYVNTWYMKFSVPGDLSGSLNAIAAQSATIYWNSFGIVLSTATAHVLTTAIDLTTRQSGFGTDSAAHAGSHLGTSFPSVQAACCISELVNDRYRGGHARFYLPAASLSDMVSGRTWAPSSLSAYQNAAVSFRSAINALALAGSSWQLVGVRFFNQHQLLTSPKVNAVIGTAVRSRVDTMRRRLGKELV